MARFGRSSLSRLDQLHPDLKKVLNVAIKERDFTIIEGHRDKQAQDHYFNTKKSNLMWPQSKHNKVPSLAVDVAPWFREKPHIRWSDIEAFRALGNYIIGVAAGLGIKIRWGGDWAMNLGVNWDYSDQSFIDLPHLELVE